MINANFLYFSRTLTNDYRWLYTDERLTSDDKKCIMGDYAEFESNRSFFVTEKHMIVRQVTNGVVFYRFSETDRIDQTSRKVYALSGVFFSGFNYEIIFRLYEYIISYFFEYKNMFEIPDDEILDSIDGEAKILQVSLDTVLDKCNKNRNVLFHAEKVATYLKKANCCNLMITSENVTSINMFTTRCVNNFQNEMTSIKKNVSPENAEYNKQPLAEDKKISSNQNENVITTESYHSRNNNITFTKQANAVTKNIEKRNILKIIIDMLFPQ